MGEFFILGGPVFDVTWGGGVIIVCGEAELRRKGRQTDSEDNKQIGERESE